MRGDGGRPLTGVGTLARLSAAIMAVLALILIPMGAAGAQEAYPPDAIVNIIDPFTCSPGAISGGIGRVQPGSTLTGTLTISGVQVSQSTATAPASGNVRYSVVVPPNTFGPAVVTASGTNTIGQPFTLQTTGSIVPCPAALPQTGNSDTRTWITLGVAALLAGGFLVVVSARRRQHALQGTGAGK